MARPISVRTPKGLADVSGRLIRDLIRTATDADGVEVLREAHPSYRSQALSSTADKVFRGAQLPTTDVWPHLGAYLREVGSEERSALLPSATAIDIAGAALTERDFQMRRGTGRYRGRVQGADRGRAEAQRLLGKGDEAAITLSNLLKAGRWTNRLLARTATPKTRGAARRLLEEFIDLLPAPWLHGDRRVHLMLMALDPRADELLIEILARRCELDLMCQCGPGRVFRNMRILHRDAAAWLNTRLRDDSSIDHPGFIAAVAAHPELLDLERLRDDPPTTFPSLAIAAHAFAASDPATAEALARRCDRQLAADVEGPSDDPEPPFPVLSGDPGAHLSLAQDLLEGILADKDTEDRELMTMVLRATPVSNLDDVLCGIVANPAHPLARQAYAAAAADRFSPQRWHAAKYRDVIADPHTPVPVAVATAWSYSGEVSWVRTRIRRADEALGIALAGTVARLGREYPTQALAALEAGQRSPHPKVREQCRRSMRRLSAQPPLRTHVRLLVG